MERLTSRDSKGNLCLCNKEIYGNNQDIYNAIATLEDYENTGITPEQLQVISEEYSKMAKELAELRQQNQWIPVSELLPDYDEEVLITNGKYVIIDERRYLENTEDGEAYTWDINGWDDVIAWRPLPELYKE